MKILFSEHAWEDYILWRSSDRRMLLRVNTLIRDIQRDPFEGIGKPEKLKHALAGYWSRRITDAHRIVYRISDEAVQIVQLRYHY